MKIKIGTKIGIVFLIFFIEIALFMSTFLYFFNQHKDHIIELHGEIEELDVIKDVQLALIQLVMPLNDFLILGGDPNEPENFKTLTTGLEDLLEEFNTLKFEQAAELELAEYIEGKYYEIKKIGMEIFSIHDAKSSDKAGRLMEEADSIADGLTNKLETFHEVIHKEIKRLMGAINTVSKTLNLIFIFGVLLNVILILCALFFFRRIISSPIVLLKNAALGVGRGDLKKRVDIKLKDELGDLGNAFNMMVSNQEKVQDNLKTAYEKLRETQSQLIQAEKMETVGRLASGVAHEVRNPLAIILQWNEYLTDKIKTGDKDILSALKYIKDSVGRANSIIKGLLDFSSLSKLQISKFNINNVLEDALALVKYQLDKGNVQVKKNLKDGLAQISIDRNKIQQTFLNIFMNAFRAMPKGGILTVKTYAKKLTKAGGKVGRRESDIFYVGDNVVVVEIEDTGSGISEPILDKIFDPFFTTGGSKNGTGLGLPIVNNIIQMHRANIEIRNREDAQGVKVVIMFKE